MFVGVLRGPSVHIISFGSIWKTGGEVYWNIFDVFDVFDDFDVFDLLDDLGSKSKNVPRLI